MQIPVFFFFSKEAYFQLRGLPKNAYMKVLNLELGWQQFYFGHLFNTYSVYTLFAKLAMLDLNMPQFFTSNILD